MCMHIEMKVEQLAAIHTTKIVIQCYKWDLDKFTDR
jgi:hypothetical protein